MAVAHDAAVESATVDTGSTSTTSFTWNHTGRATASGGVQGVLVFTFVNANAADALSVTYGGVHLGPVANAEGIDTANEPGRCKAWFLGSGIPGGTQAVVVNRVNNSDVMYAVSISVTAASDTQVHLPGIVVLNDNQALSEQSVTDGSPGTNSLRYAGVNSGLGTHPPAGGSSTELHFFPATAGARSISTVRETTAGQGARNVGFSASTDDVAAVHLAIKEVSYAPTSLYGGVAQLPASGYRLLYDFSLYEGGEKRPRSTGGTGGEPTAAYNPAQQDWHQDTVMTYRAMTLPKTMVLREYQEPWWPSFGAIASAIAKQDWHIDTTRTPSPRDVQRSSRYELFPDAGEQWWTSFPTPITNQIVKQDWHQETTRTSSTRHPVPNDAPSPDWIFTNLPVAAFDFTLRDWGIVTELPKNPQHKLALQWLATLEDTQWNVANLTPNTNPAIQDWTTKTTQTPQRDKQPKLSEQRTDWLAPVLQPTTNPAIQDWHQETVRTPQRDKQPKLSEERLDWIATLDPAVNAAMRTWFIETTRTPQRDRQPKLSDHKIDWMVALDPAVNAAIHGWHIETTRTATSQRHPYPNDLPAIDWIFGVLGPPPFDPSLFMWMIDSLRNIQDYSLYLDSEKRASKGSGGGGGAIVTFDPSLHAWTIQSGLWVPRTRPVISWTKSGYFTAVYTMMRDWTIASARTPSARRPYPNDAPSADWIFTSLPTTFDFTLRDWGIATDLLKNPQYKRALQWLAGLEETQWAAAVLHPSANPAIQEWTIDTSRTPQRDRQPKLSDQKLDWLIALNPAVNPAIQDWHLDTTRTPQRDRQPKLSEERLDWLAALNPASNPALGGWTIQSDRTRLVRMIFWDQQRTEWITANLPAAFDPATMVWTIDATAMPRRYSAVSVQIPNTDWIFTNLPAGQPAILHLHVIRGDRPDGMEDWMVSWNA